MSVNNYSFRALTGGGAGALDAINGTNLSNTDLAIGFVTDTLYVYWLDDDSGAAESSPDVIQPDSNGGNKRWILIGSIGTSGTLLLSLLTLANTGLHLLDTNASHDLIIAPGSDLTADRTLTITTGDASVTLNLTDNVLGSDGTAGRVLRHSRLTIQDGTNASTIKCTLSAYWNGDAIAATDNISKGATTGDFTLGANGAELGVEETGLSGNCVAVISGTIGLNASQTDITVDAYQVNNNIRLDFYDTATGAVADLTTLVDTGMIFVEVSYITDA